MWERYTRSWPLSKSRKERLTRWQSVTRISTVATKMCSQEAGGFHVFVDGLQWQWIGRLCTVVRKSLRTWQCRQKQSALPSAAFIWTPLHCITFRVTFFSEYWERFDTHFFRLRKNALSDKALILWPSLNRGKKREDARRNSQKGVTSRLYSKQMISYPSSEWDQLNHREKLKHKQKSAKTKIQREWETYRESGWAEIQRKEETFKNFWSKRTQLSPSQ